VNRWFYSGRELRSDIRGGSGKLICRFESREYLLATLATRNVSFQGRYLVPGKKTLVIGSERFGVRAFRARDIFGAGAQMGRERIVKASFAVVRRHSPLLC
jgi:hypothetical protein